MDEQSQDKIRELREDISAIDADIFALIKKREQLSAKIGMEKRKLSIPDKDFAREKEVFEHAFKLAEELALPKSYVLELQKLIIEISLSRQEKDRIRSVRNEHALSVLIIGGSGRLGSWLCRFFADSGHRITVMDKRAPDFSCSYQQSLEDFQDIYNVIIVATPIRESIKILADLSLLKPYKSLIFDVSSLKSPVLNPLKKLKNLGLKVTSLHPMFGPSVELLFGKHLIITSLGDNNADKEALNLFKASSLTVLSMSIDEHDAAMSYLLSLSHIISILFFDMLATSDIKIAELEKFSSPTFSKILAVAKNVALENPHLYYEIQALNPHNKNIYSKLKTSLDVLLEAISNKREDNFVEIIEKGKSYLHSQAGA
jgi:chorismate mutase/prephenate dehydrogenase